MHTNENDNRSLNKIISLIIFQSKHYLMRRFFPRGMTGLLKGKNLQFKLDAKVEAEFFGVNHITIQNRFNG